MNDAEGNAVRMLFQWNRCFGQCYSERSFKLGVSGHFEFALMCISCSLFSRNERKKKHPHSYELGSCVQLVKFVVITFLSSVEFYIEYPILYVLSVSELKFIQVCAGYPITRPVFDVQAFLSRLNMLPAGTMLYCPYFSIIVMD